jgi:hypothetical protein
MSPKRRTSSNCRIRIAAGHQHSGVRDLVKENFHQMMRNLQPIPARPPPSPEPLSEKGTARVLPTSLASPPKEIDKLREPLAYLNPVWFVVDRERT